MKMIIHCGIWIKIYAFNCNLAGFILSGFKGALSYFSKVCFVFYLKNHLQRCQFKISVKMVKPFGCTKHFCVLQLPISYWAIISRYVFSNIFQTEPFSAVKFVMGKI